MNGNVVSILVPVFNGERYVGAAIDSVLRQAHANKEVIAINDGSIDGTEGILRSYEPRLRWISQENMGVAGAFNKGLELVQGDFIGFCAADDLWAEDKLELQLRLLATDRKLDMVFGHVEQFVSPDVDDASRQNWNCPRNPMPGYHAGTMLIRRSSLFRVGEFETKWKFGEFLDWFARAEECGLRHVMLPDVVYRRRIHGANLTIRERGSQQDYVHILRARLARKRRSDTP